MSLSTFRGACAPAPRGRPERRRLVASETMTTTSGRGGGYESPSLQTLMRRSWERPRERDWAEVLGALPLFARLGKRQLRRLAKFAKVADYSPGEVIVQKGERGDSFYLMLDGRARARTNLVRLGRRPFRPRVGLTSPYGPRSRSPARSRP